MLRLALLFLLFATFSGCTTLTPDSTTDDTLPTAAMPELLAVLDAGGCRYNDIVWLLPIADVQSHLPPGFTARPFTDDTGAIVINTFSCIDAATPWSAWDMFVFAHAPVMPDIVETFDAEGRIPRGPGTYDLDLYSLALHMDSAALAAIWERGGMPTGFGRPSWTDTGLRDTHFVEGTLTDEAGGSLGTFRLLEAGDLDVAPLYPHHRMWHVTESGTWLVERMMHHGWGPTPITQGPAICSLHASTLFYAVVEDMPCAIGQGAMGDMSWQGRAYWFPGVAPLHQP